MPIPTSMPAPTIPPLILVSLAQPILHFTRTDRQEGFHNTGLNLPTLSKDGYFGACHKIGDILLRMLADARPQVFAAHPALVPPTAAADPAKMALALMQMSLDDNTRIYVGAIDGLFKNHPADLAALVGVWGNLRRQLMTILE